MTRKNQFELVTASFNNKEEPVHSQFEPSWHSQLVKTSLNQEESNNQFES